MKEWLRGSDFHKFGFEEVGPMKFKRDEIYIFYITFDNWHVTKGDPDQTSAFGFRFYTEDGLARIMKEEYQTLLVNK